MRNRRAWRWLLVPGCALIVVVIGFVWFWIIPGLVVAEIRKHYDGHVTIRGCWIGLSSFGVTGLTLHESPARSSRVWARAERVTADLSIRAILHRRLTPREITIVKPQVVCRIGEDGRLATGMPFKWSKNGPTPALLAKDGRLTLAQAGRPEMVIERINGRLDPDSNRLQFSIRSRDARWGNPEVEGQFGSTNESVNLRLRAASLAADREKAVRIPFIAKSVWQHFQPSGPVQVAVDYNRPQGWAGPPLIKTVVDFEHARIDLPRLQLTASDAVGRMTYQNDVVRLDGMQGRMVSGQVTVSGTMDFQNQDSRYALIVGLDGTDLLSVPASWGLNSTGVAGRLNGSARLCMELSKRGLDMTGSTGQGTVEEASVRGIPLGRLALTLRAEGRRADIAKADGDVFAPQWIGSDVNVDAVDLKRVLAKAVENDRAGEIPVSGRLGIRLNLRMPLGRLHEAERGSLNEFRDWSGSGVVTGPELVIRSSRLRELSAAVAIRSGRMRVTDLAAKLNGHNLKGSGRIDLSAPHAFAANFDSKELPLADLTAVASSSANRVSVSGTVAARGEVTGNLIPWRITSHGSAKIAHAEAARVVIGDLPVEWETREDTLFMSIRDLDRYSGRVSARATIPIGRDEPVEGTATLAHIDTAKLSAEIPLPLQLTGLADGQARFRIPLTDGHSPIEVEAKLKAPHMTVEGIPATTVRATVAVHDGIPKFEVRADGLNGSFVVKGTGPLDHDSQRIAFDAEAKANDFQLASLWAALGGSSGPMARVQGLGTVAARIQTRGPAGSLHANGSIDVRDLKYGETYELGQFSAGFAFDPGAWRIEKLQGSLLESPIHGEFWRQRKGDGPAQYRLNLQLERASLARIFAFEPELERRLDGWASFTAQGTSQGSFQGQGEFRVMHGFIHRLPITELSIPIDWDVTPEKDFLGMVRIRDARARVAGGRLYGEATVHLGPQRHVHAELAIEHLDLRTISRADSSSSRPTPGLIDGVVTLDSPSISWPQDYTGAIDLDLTDAALVDIPILDRLDRAFGVPQGAVFNEGDLQGHIAHRAIHVDRLTLIGPLAQLHATGSISFDGRLNLRALVNTNDIIPVNRQIALGQFASAARSLRANQRAIERMADLLSTRLMKVRIEGTLHNPTYRVDQSIPVDRMAIDFFVDALRMASSGARR